MTLYIHITKNGADITDITVEFPDDSSVDFVESKIVVGFVSGSHFYFRDYDIPNQNLGILCLIT